MRKDRKNMRIQKDTFQNKKSAKRSFVTHIKIRKGNREVNRPVTKFNEQHRWISGISRRRHVIGTIYEHAESGEKPISLPPLSFFLLLHKNLPPISNLSSALLSVTRRINILERVGVMYYLRKHSKMYVTYFSVFKIPRTLCSKVQLFVGRCVIYDSII